MWSFSDNNKKRYIACRSIVSFIEEMDDKGESAWSTIHTLRSTLRNIRNGSTPILMDDAERMLWRGANRHEGREVAIDEVLEFIDRRYFKDDDKTLRQLADALRGREVVRIIERPVIRIKTNDPVDTALEVYCKAIDKILDCF